MRIRDVPRNVLKNPERAMEEERRLAYAAWTRARRSLTLVYDPGAPSPFLLEASSAEELGSTVAP
jgi:superfamily I DNA/RNA helicase